jgi:hypothetical protein
MPAWQGVMGGVSERRISPAFKIGSGETEKSSIQPSANVRNAFPDERLIALSKHFRVKFNEWIKQIEELGVEDYVQDRKLGAKLAKLRAEWGESLERLGSLPPCSVDGAHEKLAVAQMFLTFSCEADGSAIELLALATRELDQISDRHPRSDQTQIACRETSHGPFWWLDRLTRRA